jgi:hypothetical protein
MTSQPAEIDDLSVIQVAIDGMRLHLKGRERDEAIRLMHRRVDLTSSRGGSTSLPGPFYASLPD